MGKKKKEANKKKRFEKICRAIKQVRIQGAESVAIAGLKAYQLIPTETAIKKLVNLRATEPALRHGLQYAKKNSIKTALQHFYDSEKITNRLTYKIIKNNSAVYTHCHASRVTRALIYSKKQGKRFQVYNTETRPLYQGRITAKELSRAGIKVTTMVDAAAFLQIKRADIILIGCDAIFPDGSVVNKIGSGMFAQIAHTFKKPLYIITDSWKFSPKGVRIEERSFKEIWKNKPKNVRIENPAFETVEAKYITAIISELGILKPKQFIKKVKKKYPWIKR